MEQGFPANVREAQRKKYEAARAKEEAARAKEEAARAKEEAARAKEEAAAIQARQAEEEADAAYQRRVENYNARTRAIEAKKAAQEEAKKGEPTMANMKKIHEERMKAMREQAAMRPVANSIQVPQQRAPQVVNANARAREHEAALKRQQEEEAAADKADAAAPAFPSGVASLPPGLAEEADRELRAAPMLTVSAEEVAQNRRMLEFTGFLNPQGGIAFLNFTRAYIPAIKELIERVHANRRVTLTPNLAVIVLVNRQIYPSLPERTLVNMIIRSIVRLAPNNANRSMFDQHMQERIAAFVQRAPAARANTTFDNDFAIFMGLGLTANEIERGKEYLVTKLREGKTHQQIVDRIRSRRGGSRKRTKKTKRSATKRRRRRRNY